MASKVKSDFSSSYKMKSGSIDKRTLRLHRRSQEWKNQRQEETNKRRNLADLSPLQEIDSNVLSTSKRNQDSTPKKPSSASKGSKPSKKVDERRERLMKWKQEKELKRKLEAQDKNKKNPVFKVSATVQHGDFGVYKKDVKFPALKPVASKSKNNSSHSDVSSNSSLHGRAPGRSSSSKARAPALAPQAPTAKKGKGAPAAPAAASPARTRAGTKSSNQVSQRLSKPSISSRSAGSSSGRGQAAGKARLRGSESMSQQDTVEPSTSRSKRKQTTKKGKSPKAKSRTPSRVTRQTAQETSEATADGNSSNNTSMHLPDIERKDNHFNINLNKVSTSRGESFASPDFLFSAPSNVASFVFKPLSPTSAAKFLDSDKGESESLPFDNPQGGRCSTPLALKNQNAGAYSGSETSAGSKTSASPPKPLPEPGVSGAGTSRATRRPTHTRSSSGRVIVEEPPATNIPGCVEDTVENKWAVAEEKKLNQLGTLGARNNCPQFFGKRRSLQDFTDGFSPGLTRRSLRRSLRLASLTETEFKLQDSTQQPLGKTSPGATKMEVDSVAAATEDGSPGKRGDAPTPLPASSTRTPARVTFQSPAKEAGHIPMECDDGDSMAAQEPALGESKENMVPQSGAGVRTPAAEETPARGRKSVPADAFVTPGQPLSTRRSNKKRRKTDMDPGQKALSPEEWVEVLAKSPMIEMTRRTPRRRSALDTPKVQPLNFDDIEEELERSRLEMEASVSQMEKAEEQSPRKFSGAGGVCEERKKGPGAGQIVAAPSPSSQRDVPFFRALLVSETHRLTSLCSHWQEINDSTPDLSENVRGMIRTTVGQAQLLMAQRFKQFSGLVDDCEYRRGERETTTTDLQGFWDMIFYQVEDVDAKFKELERLQQDGWVVKTPKAEAGAARPAKKKRAGRANAKPVGKSKFAAFREQMRKKKEEEEAESKSAPANTVVVSVPSAAGEKETTSVSAPEDRGPVARQVDVEAEAETPAQQQPGVASGQGGQPLYPFITLTPSFAFMEQTPRQKSYVPAVPSPLLVDSTPKDTMMKERPETATPRRRSARLSWVTDLNIKEVEGVAGAASYPFTTVSTLGSAGPQSYQCSPSTSTGLLPPVSESGSALFADSKMATPKSVGRNNVRRSSPGQRRSLRQRKSMGFLKELEERPEEETEEAGMSTAPGVQDSPLDFERYLMPTHPAPHHQSPIPSAASPLRKKGKGRKSSLKSADKHRSSQGVHFDSSVVESPTQGSRLPATPFNYNSLKPRARVSTEPLLTPGTEESAAWERDDLLIDLPPMDSSRLRSSQTPRRSLRRRPSLLSTPDKKESYSTGGQDLITFTP